MVWYNSYDYRGKEGETIVAAKRARLYDALALLTVIVIIAVDQWTKGLVVQNLSPDSEVPFPLVGHYFALEYVRNSGAAFSMFRNASWMLTALILVAIGVVAYLYLRLLNSGPLFFKIIFGMIVGGAAGNLIDRALRGGSVVDFVSFRIPELHYYFAIFNVADACISVGVILLFVLVLFNGGLVQTKHEEKKNDALQQAEQTSHVQSGTLRSTEQDAQS